jgi:hypothetical protein
MPLARIARQALTGRTVQQAKKMSCLPQWPKAKNKPVRLEAAWFRGAPMLRRQWQLLQQPLAHQHMGARRDEHMSQA